MGGAVRPTRAGVRPRCRRSRLARCDAGRRGSAQPETVTASEATPPLTQARPEARMASGEGSPLARRLAQEAASGP